MQPIHPPVPMLDLKPEIESRLTEYRDAAERVLRSGTFILGPELASFEKEVAAYLGTRHAIGCNSGTDALVIGLRALGIQPGDEVICPSFSFFATAEAVSIIGAKPVFVDIEPESLNLDLKTLPTLITSKTRAIIPVPLFGRAIAMDALMEFAQARNLKVLEDVAQAFGSQWQRKYSGTWGHAGAFSFFPSKNLGAFGDAGMITTNDDSVAEFARKLRTHGSIKRYHNEHLGYNSRLDEFQAAFLRIKLTHVDRANQLRREAAKRYSEALSHLRGVRVPAAGVGTEHVFHQYTIRIDGNRRDRVQEALAKEGISTIVYYPIPIHRLAVYDLPTGLLPETERAATEVLSLPIWPEITPETQLHVVRAIEKSLGSS